MWVAAGYTLCFQDFINVVKSVEVLYCTFQVAGHPHSAFTPEMRRAYY